MKWTKINKKSKWDNRDQNGGKKGQRQQRKKGEEGKRTWTKEIFFIFQQT